MTLNCHISDRLRGSCDICGMWPARLHLPEEMHGWYCQRCCPACNLRAALRQPDADPASDPAGDGPATRSAACDAPAVT